MNAEIIYNIFEFSENNNADIAISYEILRGNGEIPDMETKKEIVRFIDLHFDTLRRAYGTGNKKLFSDIVSFCVENKDDEIDFLARVRATGNEKLITEVEAVYGNC